MKINKKHRVYAIMLIMVMLAAAAGAPAYAAGKDSSSAAAAASKDSAESFGRPVREVHMIKVGKQKYCFFVQHNVVMTPAEIAKLDDAGLTLEIIKRAGLYMKKTSCMDEKNQPLAPKKWTKAGGRFLLSEGDMQKLRSADPAEGEPVKLHMDLLLTTDPVKEDDPKPEPEEPEEPEEPAAPDENTQDQTDPADPGEDHDQDKDPDADDGEDHDPDDGKNKPIHLYSTYRKTCPELIFIAIATEKDAKEGEVICKEKEPEQPKEPKEPKDTSDDSEGEDILPEFRTIPMVDRSRGPLEPILAKGKKVTLTWIDPDHKKAKASRKPFADHKYQAAGILAILAAIAVAVLIRKKKAKDD